MHCLTREPIRPEELLRQVQSVRAGAVVLFLGTVRQRTQGRETVALDYEAYSQMALRQMAQLEAQARSRWPLVECALVHRLGHLELGEISVAVAVSAPHRREAFEAARWLIDTLKRQVPIWKKENWADGTSQWVHPQHDPATE